MANTFFSIVYFLHLRFLKDLDFIPFYYINHQINLGELEHLKIEALRPLQRAILLMVVHF